MPPTLTKFLCYSLDLQDNIIRRALGVEGRYIMRMTSDLRKESQNNLSGFIVCKDRARNMDKGLPRHADSDGGMSDGGVIADCMASGTIRNECLLYLSHYAEAQRTRCLLCPMWTRCLLCPSKRILTVP